MPSLKPKERLDRAEYPTLEPDMCDDCKRWEMTEELFHERKRKFIILCSTCLTNYDIVEL